MKSISILGTSSDAGKSWVNTAFCSLLRRKGFRVAPFKAQNMSNNSFVTLEGGEIGRAQAAQAEACGLRPIAEMNPVLLKPCGDSTSQVVLKGVPGPHVKAGNYYKNIQPLWDEVRSILDWWKSRCDVLLLEGAGSPVELNLMDRDIVNLRPIQYLDGRWLLVCDIERGGVFAQAIGTVQLMPPVDQSRGLGLVINKFRGDIRLFDGADSWFAGHIATPYLGVLPMRYDLQPETEDGFSLNFEPSPAHENLIAWVCFPRVSNTQDAQPWILEKGVNVNWVRNAQDLLRAKAIVLPGTKNTIEDLHWLRESGLESIIFQKAREGTPIIGICGGYQMLGETLEDPEGIAGRAGTTQGLGLLPIRTIFEARKRVEQVEALWDEQKWQCYEIHMGQTEILRPCEPLLRIRIGETCQPEGSKLGNIWGTYLHGFFEDACTRRAFASAAKIHTCQSGAENWQTHKNTIYSKMADLLEENLNLEGIYRYLDA